MKLFVLTFYMCLNSMIPNPFTVNNLTEFQKNIIYAHAAKECYDPSQFVVFNICDYTDEACMMSVTRQIVELHQNNFSTQK